MEIKVGIMTPIMLVLKAKIKYSTVSTATEIRAQKSNKVMSVLTV